jgi:hypothetical protein
MTKKDKQCRNKRDSLWAEAMRECRLSVEDIRMAEEMGLNPHSLIKNIPSKSERWRLPVKDWIHELYPKRQEKDLYEERLAKDKRQLLVPIALQHRCQKIKPHVSRRETWCPKRMMVAPTRGGSG